jgi:hypothetical protein
MEKAQKREKLEKAKLARERWEASFKVLKDIILKAHLSRKEMIDMCNRIPNFQAEHLEYLKNAPSPDYKSFFCEIISLYISKDL